MEELQSTQEEADTRLLLHALHAARTGSKAVIVTSEDTDVMLLCIAFQKDIPYGALPHLSDACDTEPHAICRHQQTGLAIGRHHLWQPNSATCCDTVSAFASRGKLSALKLTKRNITYQETFCQVGTSWDVQPQLFEKAQQFTCRMYVAAN